MRNIIPYYYITYDPHLQIKIKSMQKLRFVFEDVFWFLLVFNIVPQFFLNLEVEFYYINFFIILCSATIICIIQCMFYGSIEKIRKNNKTLQQDILSLQLCEKYKSFYTNMFQLLIFKIIALATIICIVGIGNLVMLLHNGIGINVRIVTMVISLISIVIIIFGFEVFQYNQEKEFGTQILHFVTSIKRNILEQGQNLLIEDGDIVTTIALSKEYLSYVYPLQECMKKTIKLSTIRNFLVFSMFATNLFAGIICFFARDSIDYSSIIKLISIISSLCFIVFYTILDLCVILLSDMYYKQQKHKVFENEKYFPNHIKLFNNNQTHTQLIRHLNNFVRLIAMSIGFTIGLLLSTYENSYSFLIIFLTLIGLFVHVTAVLPIFNIQLQTDRLKTILIGRKIWNE